MSDKCLICGKHVIEGEAIYGYDGSHWDCKFPNGVGHIQRLDCAVEGMDAALAKLKAFVDSAYK